MGFTAVPGHPTRMVVRASAVEASLEGEGPSTS
jgi:hypothetical protein